MLSVVFFYLFIFFICLLFYRNRTVKREKNNYRLRLQTAEREAYRRGVKYKMKSLTAVSIMVSRYSGLLKSSGRDAVIKWNDDWTSDEICSEEENLRRKAKVDYVIYNLYLKIHIVHV